MVNENFIQAACGMVPGDLYIILARESGFIPSFLPFSIKKHEKTHLLQKKSGKSFVVKKKAVHLHSLYNGNSATNYNASLAQLARARDL